MKKLILVLAVLFTVSFTQAQTTGDAAAKTEKTAQVKTTPAKKATKTVHHKVYAKATVHHSKTAAHKTVAKKETKATVHHSKTTAHKTVVKKSAKATVHHSDTAVHKAVAKKGTPAAKMEEKK
ncbi:MAG: hypothetical protein IH595_02170 [Bacteroidales bacterium]|nr:hypothetical protein [Bacteroidales bacterium]